MSLQPRLCTLLTGRAVLPCLLSISSVTQIALQRHHLWLFCPMPLPPDILTSSLSSSYFCHWLFMFICFLSVQDSSHEGRIPVFAMVLKPVGEHLWNEHSTGNTHAFCSQPGCLYGSVMQKHGLFPKSKYPVLFCFCYCFRQSIFQRNFFLLESVFWWKLQICFYYIICMCMISFWRTANGFLVGAMVHMFI